jgi:lactoylglutathione lyase
MARSFPMLYVADVPATVSFYVDGLGAMLDHAHDDGSYAEVHVDDLTVGLVAEVDAREHLPVPFEPGARSGPPGAFELFFEVADADEAAKKAASAGATVLAQPTDKPWGWRVAYLRDPNGIVIELACPPG